MVSILRKSLSVVTALVLVAGVVAVSHSPSGASETAALSAFSVEPGEVATVSPAVAEPAAVAELSASVLDANSAIRAATVQSIKDKQKRTIDETCDALDEVAAVMPPEQLKSQQAQCEVAKRNADAVTTEEIEAVAMKRPATATVYAEYTGPNRDVPPSGGGDVPDWKPGDSTLEGTEFLGSNYVYDGDGDGICNARGNSPIVQAATAKGHGTKLKGYSEWCAEVIGDGVGDDDGFCERQNPPGKDKAFDERCVTVDVTLDDIAADPDNLDLGRLVDYNNLLGEAETNAQAFNSATKDAVNAIRASNLAVASGGSSSCEAAVDRLKDQGIALGVVTGLAAGLEGVANTLGAFSDQVVVAAGFGGNVASAKSVLYGAAAAASVVATALEVTADTDTATNVAHTLDCLGAFRTESKTAMTDLSGDVAALSPVSIDIVELKEKTAFLIAASVKGEAVSGVDLTSVKASTRNSLQFQQLTSDQYSFSEVAGARGTYELRVLLPGDLKDADLFIFDVQYQQPKGPVLYGHTVFDRTTN